MCVCVFNDCRPKNWLYCKLHCENVTSGSRLELFIFRVLVTRILFGQSTTTDFVLNTFKKWINRLRPTYSLKKYIQRKVIKIESMTSILIRILNTKDMIYRTAHFIMIFVLLIHLKLSCMYLPLFHVGQMIFMDNAWLEYGHVHGTSAQVLLLNFISTFHSLLRLGFISSIVTLHLV